MQRQEIQLRIEVRSGGLKSKKTLTVKGAMVLKTRFYSLCPLRFLCVLCDKNNF